MLPPIEKTGVLLMTWSRKSMKIDHSFRQRVVACLEAGGLVVLPWPATDVVLLTTTQRELMQQAERSRLVKARRVSGETTVMDYFDQAYQKQFSIPLGNRDAQGLFTVHERSYLCLDILDRIHTGDDVQLAKELGGSDGHLEASGLRHALVAGGWVDVITPVHFDAEKSHVQRQTMFPLWQLYPNVDAIADYYGPSIAFYFAFSGYLARSILWLGILGLATLLWRIYRQDTIDDDEYTPFYGLICFLWAVLFLKFWDRHEHELAYRWGTLSLTNVVDDFDEEYSVSGGSGHVRAELRGTVRNSPITGLPELYYPSSRRRLSYILSAFVTSIMLAVAFFVMILSLNLQGYILPKRDIYHPFHYPLLATLAEEGNWFDASTMKSYIPVVIHVVCILTLNTVYRAVARKLTDWENHRTQDSYENSLVLKRFLFEAFDCYVVLFYLAFYERDVDRLRMELVAVFNVDSFRRILLEVIVPMLLHARVKDNDRPLDLHLDEYEQFDDYMEILIQFGYATLFASAYPLASLVLCAAVAVEIRSDCYRLTFLCQKPIAERIAGIGMWKRLLAFMVWSSCLTNCLLFGFTSDQMMHYMPSLYVEDDYGETKLVHDKGWLVIFIIFGLERVLIYVGLVIHAMIPSISEDLKVALQRRRYLLSHLARKKAD